MNKRQKMNENRECSGFTLLELVISVSILVICIGMTAPVLAKYIEKAREQRYMTEAESVCRATQLYMIDMEADGTPLTQEKLAAKLCEIEVSSKRHVLNPYLTRRATMGAEIQEFRFVQSVLIGFIYVVDDYKISVKLTGDIAIVKDKPEISIRKTETTEDEEEQSSDEKPDTD